ncbi:hypothetical protein Aph01nite_16030 [Acrocarpospora phusangensis]|uniref:Knr4/Smi1-like domain-containing protein n=1 Tax=Acrocarpospora phusangensis TaxID=1070424 RepID=A0A919Q9G0_9ACTN|nr:SMI1/KNR4 family protein [Acrocarpospora phusangensis]GIH23293.1 hypothetical protein Aph01nite_16030 [Acrocarpospora phusangensis]
MRSDVSLAQLSDELAQFASLSDIAPLSEKEVQALEGIVGAPLPEEFRSFLLRFGPGVRPGPVLNLDWIIDETLSEQQMFAEEPDAAVSASAPFPISPDDVARLPQLAAEDTEPILWFDKPMPGTMFLCGHGCTWISMLAMNGDLAGTVWMTEMGWAEAMYWWPSAPWLNHDRWGFPHSGWTEPVPFLDWYIRWTRSRKTHPT